MGEQVIGIFTMPEEFHISYSPVPVKNVMYRNFAELAEKHGVPLVLVKKKMGDDEYMETLRAWRADFCLALGWYYMVPARMRALFPKGVAGIHASLLPKYRGGAPLVWAIINGERKTGVSFFYLESGVDTGDIIAQKEIEITYDDTIKTAYEKATGAALEMLREYVPQIREGRAPRLPQDHSAATQYPQRSPEDGLIDWGRSAEEIRNFIRAQTRPYPGAFTLIGGKKVTIWDADVSDAPPAPGS
jgi:methionyl-tRNA formyltransferase